MDEDLSYLEKKEMIVNRDGIAWFMDALERFEKAILCHRGVGVSRLHEVAKIACIVEIAEILELKFEDGACLYNMLSGLPELQKLIRQKTKEKKDA